jgi:hypothetical protein
VPEFKTRKTSSDTPAARTPGLSGCPAGESGTSAPWWLILPEQFVLVAWYFSPIWITGLVRFFRDPDLRWYWGPPPARATTAIVVGYQRSPAHLLRLSPSRRAPE